MGNGEWGMHAGHSAFRIPNSALRIALFAACILVLSSGAANAEVQAGVAYEQIALPTHVPLAGYSRRKGKPSQGVHDPVGVRALVVSDPQATVALVSCDLLIIDERLAGALQQRLVDAGLPPTMQLILAATHTHSGPGAYGTKFFEKLSMGHYDPQVFGAIVEAVSRAVVQAHAARAPAAMAYRMGTAEGLARNRVTPGGWVDTDCVVIGVYRPHAREPIAVVVNFSAHPTTLGTWNMQVSADYPGVVVRALEDHFPGAVGLFVAGAVGDQAPVASGEGFDRAESFGRTLAQRAAELLGDVEPTAPREVRGVEERIALPPAQVRLGRLMLPRWLGGQFVDDDATLSVVRLGTTAFIGVPCDLTADLGAALKTAARSRGLEPVIVGFANDYIGYCVSKVLYEAKQYESSMAFNGPTTGELIVERLIRMLEDIADGT